MRDVTLFEQCLDNAERLLELELLGWSFRSVHQIRSPLSLSEVVQNVIRNLKIDPAQTRHSKPEPVGTDKNGRAIYGADIVMLMRELNPYYGELRRHLGAQWKLFYEKKAPRL